ncbi:MAG TPA: hydrogen gas-evolving membrane-bound hydrogenase subunit E [Anaerolineae bacterium]|nr:hydrogen gas-evolving membrane-bound hydrogenase subunit E [Anaerolineae bacterium]
MIIWSAIGSVWMGALLVWVLRKWMPITAARGWLLSIFPLMSLGLLGRAWWLVEDKYLSWSWAWVPAANLNISFYYDALSALFGLMVAGIGVLILIYGGYYFADDKDANRFFAYLLLFMGMMLGVVVAGDLITMFLFWEGTSITSFLLVAYKYKYESARKGAFKALFITGGGGIALLAGSLFLGHIAGGYDFKTIFSQAEVIQQHELYWVVLGLIAFGAFTKSAQVPAHIWLPAAMSAPTPASAYLHSATMVKAGIYLLARLNPALGGTESWFWLLSTVGLVTMVTGAYWGIQQDDLKGLLAYSTISQLGVLTFLIGQETEIAFKALVIGVIAHALFKSALFMCAGIIDHETGTRLLSRLGGLRQSMPITFVVVVMAGLSLAGSPPMFGFLAKETLLATAVHPTLSTATSWLFVLAIVVAAAFKLVQAGLVIVDVFMGEPRDKGVKGHEAPWGMVMAPLLPALASMGVGLLPNTAIVATFFGKAAEAAYGDKVKVSLALWTGINIPLLLSMGAITAGLILFSQRSWLIKREERWSFNRVYDGVLGGMDRLAFWATRTQTGYLRHYLAVMMVAMWVLVLLLWRFDWPTLAPFELFDDTRLEFDLIRLVSLVTIVAAAVTTIVLKRDFGAILALGAVGLSVAVYMAVEPAPDVALVQIVVDLLATVILVLALDRLPREQRRAAQTLQSQISWLRAGIATGGGLLVAGMSYMALSTRPRVSLVTPYYEQSAKALTGASDIVGAVIVDFRALDTLIEITVFSLAGIGVFTLFRWAARKHGDHEAAVANRMEPSLAALMQFSIGERPVSAYLQAVVTMVLPVALVIGGIHMLYGHEQPGDGFTAGVIISLAIGLWYVVFGFRETRRRLWWLRPHGFISLGVLLVIVTGLISMGVEGYFLASVDFGKMIGLPLPEGMKFSSGFLFEVAIASAVVGGVSLILDTLGRPAALAVQIHRAAQAEFDEAEKMDSQ